MCRRARLRCLLAVFNFIRVFPHTRARCQPGNGGMRAVLMEHNDGASALLVIAGAGAYHH